MSVSTIWSSLGRWILTATSVPSASVARWTWAIEAEAKGSDANFANNSLACLPNSFSSMCADSSAGNGATESCKPLSAATMSGGSTSGLLLMNWPNLTNVGPSSVNARRSRSPLESWCIAGSRTFPRRRMPRGKYRSKCMDATTPPNPYLTNTPSISPYLAIWRYVRPIVGILRNIQFGRTRRCAPVPTSFLPIP